MVGDGGLAEAEGLCQLALAVYLTGLTFQLTGHPGPVPQALFVAAYAFGGFFTLREALVAVRGGRIQVDFLMLVAAAGAAAIGRREEGAVLLVRRPRRPGRGRPGKPRLRGHGQRLRRPRHRRHPSRQGEHPGQGRQDGPGRRGAHLADPAVHRPVHEVLRTGRPRTRRRAAGRRRTHRRALHRHLLPRRGRPRRRQPLRPGHRHSGRRAQCGGPGGARGSTGQGRGPAGGVRPAADHRLRQDRNPDRGPAPPHRDRARPPAASPTPTPSRVRPSRPPSATVRRNWPGPAAPPCWSAGATAGPGCAARPVRR